MSSRSSSAGYDRHITIFSPEGKLYQVDYAFNAVKNVGLTAIGVRGQDSVVIITQKKVPDKLIDPSSITHMFSISRNIGCVVTGAIADAMAIVKRARSEVTDFKYKNGHEIPVHFLAKRMADFQQVFTQHAFTRALGVTIMYIAIDDEKGPQLYMVDPAGYYSGYRACSTGKQEQEATNLLERAVKAKPTMTSADTIETAVVTLQTVVGSDLRADDIEIGIVTTQDRKFRVLSEQEIDQQLTIISNRD